MLYLVCLVLFGFLVYLLLTNTKTVERWRLKSEKAIPESKEKPLEEIGGVFDGREYHIVGMKYRRLPKYVFEEFSSGYIKHDAKNKHDDRAVGVYNDDGQCVGYIPQPDNEYLYEVLIDNDVEAIPVTGYICESDDNGYKAWVGRVFVQYEYFEL
jgi:hypothetical protein